MKSTLLKKIINTCSVFTAVAVISVTSAFAQQNKIVTSGFNQDVIADPVLNTTSQLVTTSPVDDTTGFVLYANGYSNTENALPHGLPANGIILSPTGHYYQLQPYTANNSLRLTANMPGLFSFGSNYVMPYDTVLLLATSGNGASMLQYTVYFTDGSNQMGTISIADWFCAACTSFAIDSLNRLDRVTNIRDSANYALYEVPIPIAIGSRTKSVSNIFFFAMGSNGGAVADIFGVAGEGASVLPVSLTFYKASVQNGRALLQWQTAQQLNASSFSIERASATYPDAFEPVGTVAATSATGVANYEFRNSPGVKGTFLYRLTEQDADGNKKILGVRSVTFGTEVTWLVQDLGRQWKLVANGAFHYRLTDMNGRLLQASAGSGNTIINKPFAKGVYLVQVFIAGKAFTQKVIN